MSDWISSFFLVSGGVFCLIAGVGLVRFGDIYLRMHAATKSGTLGLALIGVGSMIEAETWGNMIEVLIVFLFMIGTAPVGAHLIGRAAFRTRNPMVLGTQADPACEMFHEQAPAPLAPQRP